MNVALKESHVLTNPNFLTVRKRLFWANGTFVEFASKNEVEYFLNFLSSLRGLFEEPKQLYQYH